MKILSMIMLIFLSNGLFAQNKPHFVTQDLQCSTCHTCEVPTKNNPCVRECIREHLITVEHSASEAPENILINKLENIENIYQPVHFTHQLHAEMSHLSGGCQTCHHYNPPGRILSCNECHESERKRIDISKPDLKAAYHRQCIDCHRGWSHEVECLSCHAKIDESPTPAKVSVKSAHPEIQTPNKLVIETDCDEGNLVTFLHSEHVNLYGLECRTCHSNESCIECHDVAASDKGRLNDKETHEGCNACHDTDDNCSFCHDQKERNGFNHKSRSGWELNNSHKNLSCAECHVKKGSFAGLNRNCITCHTDWSSDNFDHSVTGIILDEIHLENECSDCHIESSYSKPSCDGCHDDISFPESIPGELVK